MDLKEKIEELSAPFLSPIDAFIVDIQSVYENRQLVIQLFVETDPGITIGQCAEISRKLAKEFESRDIIKDSYILQVSSPDLKKPLKLLRQYNKNVGRHFHVRYKNNGETREIKAKLLNVDGESLVFDTDRKEAIIVPFNDIIETIVELPW